jgi:hypothetical protein
MQSVKLIGIAMLLMLAMDLAFSAQDPSVLLEKAIYTEETLGNLGDAIILYKQIVNNADISRTTGAIALYRLGMCYRKSGNEADALTTFSLLAKLYPEQKELIAKSFALKLKPAPWADGEIMRVYQRKIGTEGYNTLSTFSAESGIEGGKPVWNLRYFFGSGPAPQIYTVTVASAGTMLPISNRNISFQTDLEAIYGANKIEVLNLNDRAQPPKQIPSTGTVYDKWAIIPLLRCLYLREGFQIMVPLFDPASGSIDNAKFEVVDRETITVPAGSFDCYKIAMAAGNDAPSDNIFWISTDSHAYLVKAHIGGANAFELQSIEIAGKDQRVGSSELGISLLAPHLWYLSTDVPSRLYLSLSAPELKSSLNVMTIPNNTTAETFATPFGNAKITLMPPSGSAAPQNRESVAIAGLIGERYIVNTTDSTSGESIVNCIYSLTGPSRKYYFSFQTDKDNFDKMKPEFESIMSSIRIQ